MKTPDPNAMLMRLAKAQAFVWGHRDGMEGREDTDLLDRIGGVITRAESGPPRYDPTRETREDWRKRAAAYLEAVEANDGDPVAQAYLKGYNLGKKHRRAE